MIRTLSLAALALVAAACSAPEPTTLALAVPEVATPDPLIALPDPDVALAQPVLTSLQALPPLQVSSTLTLVPADAASVREIRAVRVRFELSGVPASAAVALEFVAPQDVIYERRQSALEGGAFVAQVLEYELPVAGTAIDVNGLAGLWGARLNIDGEPVAAHEFELKP
jgi:hypothetical protein